MTKIKKHSGLSKVLKVRKGGTISMKKSGLNHKTGKKNGADNRKKRKNKGLSKADYNRLKNLV